ncbi:MAG: TerB family tellurite resistance protein [Thermodesulfobacteriota bacterium]|nr:TerB family tellurite resistance protein [Thermodesulfobacteriota bacterium]
MAGFLKKIFTKKYQKSIEQDTIDPGIAACVLMLEVSMTDNEFSDDERQYILSLIERDRNIDKDQAKDILGQAEKQRQDGIDLWHFTKQINSHFSQDEKIRLIEEIWRIIYMDKRLDGHEDHLVHLLSSLLHLTHSQLIDAKLKVKKEVMG